MNPVEETRQTWALGVSVGLALTLDTGPGFHLDGEWLKIQGHSEFAFVGGLHWDFVLF